MSNHRYILDPGARKWPCPKCCQKRFVLFVDMLNNNYAGENYGRCDREQKCGHLALPPLQTKANFVPFQHMIDYNEKSYKLMADHKTYYLPKSQVFEVLPNGCYASAFILENSKKPPPFSTSDFRFYDSNKVMIKLESVKAAPSIEVSYINKVIMQKSLGSFENNTLVSFLIVKLGEPTTKQLCEKYHIGTTKSGATIFWQIDVQGRVRSGKIIQYLPDGHRNKKINPSWSHSKLKLKDFNLSQCLFGLHLLQTNDAKPICIVESEKTAIISSAYFPEYIWMASGGKSNLSIEKLNPVKHRQIIFWPDLAAFNDWLKISEKLNASGFSIRISDFLESHATDEDKAQGLDLADYLLQFPLQSIPQNENNETSEAPKTTFLFQLSDEPHAMSVDWFRNLADFDPRLNVHFINTTTPIHDFIQTHVNQVKQANTKASYDILCSLQQQLLNYTLVTSSISDNTGFDLILD